MHPDPEAFDFVGLVFSLLFHFPEDRTEWTHFLDFQLMKNDSQKNLRVINAPEYIFSPYRLCSNPRQSFR